MDTLRVDICYRPLRIGWAIKSDDFQAFRKAVRYSYALWGGRFNPILFVDHEYESNQLIDLFRVDVIIPVGNGDEVKDFPSKYPYLIKPFFHDPIFMKGSEQSHPSSYVLDIYNALIYLRDKPEWKEIKDAGVHYYSWAADDPLADIFLSQLGGYPDKDEVGTDYLELLRNASEFTEISLDSEKPISAVTIDHPSISYLSRYGMDRHYGIDSGSKYPGYFVGSGTNLEDLVCHWNLRACDIPLWFIDPQYLERYTELLPAWEKAMRDQVAGYRHEWDRKIAIWTRWEDMNEARKPFGESQLILCRVLDATWNGLNVRAPMMYFGEASVLGVMSDEGSKPKVSFALSNKPFDDDIWFYQQHLVASVSLIGGLYGNEQYTFNAPYLPELNEFYARTMHFEYDKLRIEPGRIGIVIDAADHDSFLYALPVAEFMERIFDMAGYEARLSNAGLITKQLIKRLGGVQGGRVFKVPGVRRLLKIHGPNASITKKEALQIIGSTDPNRPDAKFSDHKNLYIESRQKGEALTPGAVFGYLVEKGLFRIGVDLHCPSCKMKSWIPLDSLKQKIVCELCGHEHDVTRNLTNMNQWHYRRSGVLGIEKNAQGAVPVCLTLQQLETNCHGDLGQSMYSPSLDLKPKAGIDGVMCETDFVWVVPRVYLNKTVVVLAECKDAGPITIDDVSNLKRIADSLPTKRFETFIILSQISPFTDDEIRIAKTLNDQYRYRAILLSANELEPFYLLGRVRDKSGIELNWSSPKEMAMSTNQLYFTPKKVDVDNKI
jgi:hypothetical protein